MTVTVTKLRGNDIPEAMRGPDVQVVFRVTDHEGNTQYLLDDVEAAQSAVRASDNHQAGKE
ncbi:hypothetical protein [Stutzerimonas chloritidismutans]|uniref:Uncharacterized protein n=1 Tax=Stutzerimonas chloritidismutans TaxID=203192 RepID=A0ABU9MI99_STUCH